MTLHPSSRFALPPSRFLLRGSSAAALALVLAACGGGGGGTPFVAMPPAAAPATTTPGSDQDPANPTQPASVPAGAPAGFTASYAAQRYDFSWSPVADATYYEVLEDPDGTGPNPAVAIGGQLAATQYSYAVDLLNRVGATYSVRACNAAGCSADAPTFTPDPVQAIGYLKASNTRVAGPGGFGYAMALSGDGNTLAVGTWGDSSNATGIDGDASNTFAPRAGAVYVYVRTNGTWAQQNYVKASNTNASDEFGYSVALSADGSTLAVGAVGESSNAQGIGGNPADNSAGGSGAVYVFDRTGSSWTQQAYLKASNSLMGLSFGGTVALSGDGKRLAAGAIGEGTASTGVNGPQSGGGATGSGAAYVFARSGSAWTQEAYVKASNTRASAAFSSGLALSADGQTLAVGSRLESSGASGIDGNQADINQPGAGAVYVFVAAGSAWSQQAYVKASSAVASQQFGYTVALSQDGSTLAVGANGDSSGAVGVGGDPSNFTAPGSGAAYVFSRTGAAWAQQAYVKATNRATSAAFGSSVALAADGNTLAVGALGASGSSAGIDGSLSTSGASAAGAAYTYVRTGSTWAPQHYVKASNPGTGDRFGWAIALSADADTLAVSATDESSAATGIGGDQTDNSASGAGAAYVY